MTDLAYCLSEIIAPAFSTEFNQLVLDSRQVKNNDVFVALSGDIDDGHNYIQQALDNGAVAVLAERDVIKNERVILVPELRKKLSTIASRFYGQPSTRMSVVGVTGTNGKSSITHFISQSLKACNRKCGVIGTIGYGFLPELISTAHTTPDAITLQKMLAEFKEKGADSVAMEVSSHGLHQERVSGIHFETAVFTNLTRDHLDYHGTMDNYKAQKKRLFSMPNLKNAVVNCDDAFGKEIIQSIDGSVNTVGYALQKHADVNWPMIVASDIRQNSKGFSAKIESPWGVGELRGSLLGQFNISNVLAVLGVLNVMGVEFQQTLEALSHLHTVRGRMQAFGGDKQALVVVDYSHTPDALQQALLALKPHTNGKLWCVFGCGGDRDRGKRPLMGQIAERYSDQLILTNDNPRTESPQSIIEEIKSGLLCPWAAEVELDRGAAIAHAIDCAEAGDVILIAGKGHESYQIIGDEKLPFSDIERVQQQTADKRLRD